MIQGHEKKGQTPIQEIDIRDKSWLKTNIAYISMFIVIILWGSSWPVTRYVSTNELGTHPFTSAFIRMTFAIPFLLLAVRLIDGNLIFPRRLLKPIMILGFFQVAMHNFFFLSGLRFTSGSDGVLIINAGIAVIAPILAHRAYNDEKLTRIRVIGIFISLVGVLLIFSLSPNDNVENRILGNFLILGAATSWSIYTVYSRPIVREISPISYQLWAVIFGWSYLALFALSEQINSPNLVITFDTGWRLAYLGVFAAAIAYTLYNVSIKHLGATRTAVIVNFAPLFGIFFSIVFADEKFSFMYPIAFLIIFVGIYLVNKE